MRLTLLLLLVVSIFSVHANEMLIRPLTGGGWNITQVGASSQIAPNIFSHRQLAGKKMIMHVMAEGYGTCNGGKLSGRGALSFLNISLTAVVGSASQAADTIACGETVNFDSPSQLQRVGIKVELSGVNPDLLKSTPQDFLGKKILLGNISFTSEDNDFQTHAIYLDFTMVRDSLPTLRASFNKSTLLLGEVNAFRDAREMLTLSISKTQQASNVTLPYILKFESSQVRDNSFQLKSSQGDIFVPYKVLIDSKNISPNDEYHGIVPAGTATSDIVQVGFLLASGQVNGIAAGTKLTDVLTAVIVPDS